jgi:hypothetical protein
MLAIPSIACNMAEKRTARLPDPKPGPLPSRVRAPENRIVCEITFPRLPGYRDDVGDELLSAIFTPDSRLALSTPDQPTTVENAPILGESSIHPLDDLERRRPNEVAFLLAKLAAGRYVEHWGNEPDPGWAHAIAVHYLGRRGMLGLATDPRFTATHAYNIVAMANTRAFPASPG